MPTSHHQPSLGRPLRVDAEVWRRAVHPSSNSTDLCAKTTTRNGTASVSIFFVLFCSVGFLRVREPHQFPVSCFTNRTFLLESSLTRQKQQLSKQLQPSRKDGNRIISIDSLSKKRKTVKSRTPGKKQQQQQQRRRRRRRAGLFFFLMRHQKYSFNRGKNRSHKQSIRNDNIILIYVWKRVKQQRTWRTVKPVGKETR